MLREEQARAISILSNAAAGLALNVPGSDVAVKNIIKQIEVLSAMPEVDNTLSGGNYPIAGSGWTLNIVDGAFSLQDEQGVVRLKVKANPEPEPETPEPEQSFEDMLAKRPIRDCYTLLTTLLTTPVVDSEERGRQLSLVGDKLGIAVIRL